MLSNNELTWKKICNGCYLEKNVKINCEKCNRLFNRKINEKWKKIVMIVIKNNIYIVI